MNSAGSSGLFLGARENYWQKIEATRSSGRGDLCGFDLSKISLLHNLARPLSRRNFFLFFELPVLLVHQLVHHDAGGENYRVGATVGVVCFLHYAAGGGDLLF